MTESMPYQAIEVSEEVLAARKRKRRILMSFPLLLLLGNVFFLYLAINGQKLEGTLRWSLAMLCLVAPWVLWSLFLSFLFRGLSSNVVEEKKFTKVASFVTSFAATGIDLTTTMFLFYFLVVTPTGKYDAADGPIFFLLFKVLQIFFGILLLVMGQEQSRELEV